MGYIIGLGLLLTFVSIAFILKMVSSGDTSLIVGLVEMLLVGLLFLIYGIFELIKYKRTEKFGSETYAIIRDISTNYKKPGSINEATLEVINPVTNQFEIIRVNVGTDADKYEINTYVLCKYHNRDVHIKKIVILPELPEEVKQLLHVRPIKAQGGETETYGIQCYAIVRDIATRRLISGNIPVFEATFEFISPQTNHLELFNEEIGTLYQRFPINSYVLCRYHEGKLFLGDIVNCDAVPEEIRNRLPLWANDKKQEEIE